MEHPYVALMCTYFENYKQDAPSLTWKDDWLILEDDINEHRNNNSSPLKQRVLDLETEAHIKSPASVDILEDLEISKPSCRANSYFYGRDPSTSHMHKTVIR